MAAPSDEERLADIVVDAIKLAVTPLYERIKALEARERQYVTFAAPWKAGETYARNTTVIRNRKTWIAITDGATADPGKPPEPHEKEWMLYEDRNGSDGR